MINVKCPIALTSLHTNMRALRTIGVLPLRYNSLELISAAFKAVISQVSAVARCPWASISALPGIMVDECSVKLFMPGHVDAVT